LDFFPILIKTNILNPGNSIQSKILTLSEGIKKVAQWRLIGKTISFTNGCFDIIHAGHISSLIEASSTGNILIVGLNSDLSPACKKGINRPVNDQNSRALVLASLSMVDAVIIFDEPTPIDLINALKPDVLIKGGDYKIDEIVGAKEVMSWGGKVVINRIIAGFSTTSIINKFQNPGKQDN
jgi:rfaE bifunctional protein nucleotidyltransferase chain/domain